MGADIAALIMKEFVIDCEDTTVAVDGGPDAMKLLARMVGGSKMFTTIFDPFHRPAEAQGRETYQHVLGIKLTANAKSTADMTLEEIYADIKVQYYIRLRALFVLTGLSIILSLLIVFINAYNLGLFGILLKWFVALLNVLTIIWAILFVIFII